MAVSAEDLKDDLFIGMVEESAPLVVPTISSRTDPWTVDIY